MNMSKITRPPRPMVAALVLLLAIFLSGCPLEKPAQTTTGVKFAADPEFVCREEGLLALQETYNFHLDQVYEIAIGLTHEALRAGDVDAALGFSTDGKIEELDLVNLEDNRGVFPSRHPAPVVREVVLARYPEIAPIMAAIAARLDTETMIHLNYLVDIKDRDPDVIARRWLLNTGLIAETPLKPRRGKPVAIGSKEYTEQQILGEITRLALKNAGIPVESHPLSEDIPANRAAMLAGHVHPCWEHAVTVWETLPEKDDNITDPEEIQRRITRIDAEDGLVWLDQALLNNSYTIMMRREHAAALGISSISELASWIRQIQDKEVPVN